MLSISSVSLLPRSKRKVSLPSCSPDTVKNDKEGDLDAQRMMFEEVLPELLRERGETDQTFLAKFVQFVTGLSYVPHKSVSSFKILVCFENVYKQLGNLGDEPADWLPSVHTCEPSISLPVHAYNGSRERLERALDISMSMSTNELDKN